ncbi:MAG TPA: Bro-N domain-containing protein [Acetobacteraceae bacterium]|nr:Bro-N domain-containing protein [Acetobacteraceae bacterium]
MEQERQSKPGTRTNGHAVSEHSGYRETSTGNQTDRQTSVGNPSAAAESGTDLIIEFQFQDARVRTVAKDGETWFVAADVCEVLEHTNSRKAVGRLEDDEKGVTTVYTPGGNQEMTIVSESGLYALVFTSRKPEARAFRRWVTGEVLPAIRKSGRYERRPAAVEPTAFGRPGRYVTLVNVERQARTYYSPYAMIVDDAAEIDVRTLAYPAVKCLVAGVSRPCAQWPATP